MPPRLTRMLDRGHVIGQALRFGLMTAISASVTIGLPVLLHEAFGVAPPVAAAIAFVVAFVSNFISLRRLVFRSVNGVGRDLMTFAGSSLAFRLLDYGAFLLLNLGLGVHYVAALVIVLTLSTAAKFVWYRRVMTDPSRIAVPSDA